MALVRINKRKVEDGLKGWTGRPKRHFRKQRDYHSSSEDCDPASGGFSPVDLEDSSEEEGRVGDRRPVFVSDNPKGGEDVSSCEENSSEVDEDDTGFNDRFTLSTKRKLITKRNDPEAFSKSISKILSTKLSQSARTDPVLSRSREAANTSNDIANERLEKKARAKLRTDRKEDLERDRVKDVQGLTTGDAGETAEEEKRLRKMAQGGVIKLFNAVRAAQVKGEEAAKEERRKGTIGSSNLEEKVNEVSKQGFLELINGKGREKPIEQA